MSSTPSPVSRMARRRRPRVTVDQDRLAHHARLNEEQSDLKAEQTGSGLVLTVDGWPICTSSTPPVTLRSGLTERKLVINRSLQDFIQGGRGEDTRGPGLELVCRCSLDSIECRA